MPSGQRDERVAQNKRTAIGNVIAQARRYGWSDEYLVLVMEAQLAPSRLMWGVYGPCAYCGTWLASVVDHIYPVVLGGTNHPDNLASSCARCNGEKGSSLPGEWPGMNAGEWYRRHALEDAMFHDATHEQRMAAIRGTAAITS